MKVKKLPKFIYFVIPLVIIIGVTVFLLTNRAGIDNELFLAPGRDYPSKKRVEDYFVERLRMSPQEAVEVRSNPSSDGRVTLRLRESTTLEGLLGNLEYYGFIRDKEALRYALEHTTDNVEGSTNTLKVGETNTIDTWATYRISEEMSAWEIADELLNKPTHFEFDEYGYMFMP